MKSDAKTTHLGGESRTFSDPIAVDLPNGGTIFIRPEVLDPSGNVGVLDLDFNWFRESLDGLAAVVKDAFEQAKPTKTAVELNLQLGLKAGKLAAMLVDANTTASFKVTLEWDRSKP